MADMIKNILLLATLVFHSLTISVQAGTPVPADTTTLVLLSVNDMHARIDQFPQFISLVDSIRSEHKHVLLFSAGDMFTGNPVVDQYPEKGYPIIELMNIARFDATATGNHEFDYGQETLLKRMKQAEFPFLSANIHTTADSPMKFRPYHIITLANGIKVGLISFIQLNEAGLPDSHPSRLGGITFTDALATAPAYAFLRDSCEVFVALTHLGFETDVKLTEVFPFPDIILGGHTHTLVTNPRTFNNVPVMQAGSGLRHATIAVLKVANGKVTHLETRNLDIRTHSGFNAEALALVEKYNDNPELNQVIGTAVADIAGSDELGSLITDAMASVAPLEIAFQNKGGIRTDNLPKGDITIKDVFRLDPFGNELIHFMLSLDDVKSLIINAYNREKSIDLYPSGITYTVITDPEGMAADVEIRLPDGSQPAPGKLYHTGVSSYVASSYTFSRSSEGESLYIITAQSLINFIRNKKLIDYSGTKRAFVRQP